MAEYAKSILDNGLRVVIVEMPHLHSVEMACLVGVGARNDPPGEEGLTHFLEHMLFRGTAEHPTSVELERAFERIGGAVNAVTDAESTMFHSRLHPDRVAQGMALFASMLMRPRLDELEIERRIILEEALDDLNERGEEINPDNLTAALQWPGEPVSRPIIGSRDSISRIDLAGLRRHLARYFTPSNTVLAVAGRVAAGQVLEDARALFADWQGHAPPPAEMIGPLAEEEAPRSVWVKDPGSQVAVQLNFRLPGRNDFRVPALKVLRRILAWGGASRLIWRLRESRGLTYSVDANLSLYADCGALAIDLAVMPENLASAVEEALDVVAELAADPVPEEELGAAVQSILFDLDYSRDHAEGLGYRYGWGELVGWVRTLEQDRREMAAVTPGQIHETVRELLRPGALAAAFVGPWTKAQRRAVEKLLSAYRRG